MKIKYLIPRAKIFQSFSVLLKCIASVLLRRQCDTRQVQEFEDTFKSYYNHLYAIALPRARVAFYHVLKYLDLQPGREVIISAIHISDFVNMIHLLGLRPVFVDLMPGTLNVDYNDLEKKVNTNTGAVLITHLSGYATDMDKVSGILKKYDTPLIQDCSQAYNSFYKGRHLSFYGYASIFSMTLLKPVDTCNGGMLLSRDSGLIASIRETFRPYQCVLRSELVGESIKTLLYKVSSTSPVFKFVTLPVLKVFDTLFAKDFIADFVSANDKLQNVLRDKYPKEFLRSFSGAQAEVGLRQMLDLKILEDRRKRSADYLRAHIRNSELQLPQEVEGAENGNWLFPVFVEEPARLKSFLLCHSIDSFTFLLVLLAEEQCYSHFAEYSFGSFVNHTPNAAVIRRTTLFLPLHIDMSLDELRYLTEILNRYNPRKN